MPLCFPYVRFSTQKQKDGNSVVRQSERIESFVSRHNLTVDTRLEDHGISSFRGANAKKGQLSGFLQKVRDGEIPRGSYFLIENWDRLSRQVLDASIEIFSDLIRAGIKIAVLDEDTVYDDLTSNSFIRAIVQFERAHSESLRKSDMSKASWRAKHKAMAEGTIATEKCPQWLTVTDGAWIKREDICMHIETMFSLAQTYGVAETGRRLNTQFGTSYKTHQIQRLLGEHSPVERSKEHGKNVPTGQVVELYYPQVIPPATFEEVQTILKSRKPFSGRQDATNLNIFRNLLVCAECGGSTRFMLRSGKEFYYCTASMTGGCVDDQIRSIRGEFLRRVLFKFEHWTAIRDYIAAGSDVLKALKKEETVAVANLTRLETKADGLRNKYAAEDDEDKAETYASLLNDTRKAITATHADLARIKQELASLDGAFALTDSNADSFESMLTCDSEQARTDRQRLNRYLRGIFLKLELHFPTRKLVTQPIPALANRISPVVASIKQPKDNRTGDDYGHHTWISKDQQTLIIRRIKARLRRAGIPSPTFEQVKPIYESVAYSILPKRKPQCKNRPKLADLPEELKDVVLKAPDLFLK